MYMYCNFVTVCRDRTRRHQQRFQRFLNIIDRIIPMLIMCYTCIVAPKRVRLGGWLLAIDAHLVAFFGRVSQAQRAYM